MKRAVRVRLGRLATEAIGGGKGDGNSRVSAGAARAIRCYLNDRGRIDAGWAYPSFLDERTTDERVELGLSVEEGLWRALEDEAAHQNVSVPQMLEHAVLYFAAETDAGRVAERILGDLDDER